MADEYIKRQGLLDAYDAAHKGPPGGARKLIAEAPAEDVVPVVHGRWEVYMDGKYLMCSACKASFWDETGDGGTNYCPNCGARMDGDN